MIGNVLILGLVPGGESCRVFAPMLCFVSEPGSLIAGQPGWFGSAAQGDAAFCSVIAGRRFSVASLRGGTLSRFAAHARPCPRQPG